MNVNDGPHCVMCGEVLIGKELRFGTCGDCGDRWVLPQPGRRVA